MGYESIEDRLRAERKARERKMPPGKQTLIAIYMTILYFVLCLVAAVIYVPYMVVAVCHALFEGFCSFFMPFLERYLKWHNVKVWSNYKAMRQGILNPDFSLITGRRIK